MQPQSFNSGNNLQSGGDPGRLVSPQTGGGPALPSPVPADSAVPLPIQPIAPVPPIGSPLEGIDVWAHEIEQAIASTHQDPKKRADMLNEIKARYQNQVLGLKVKE